MKFSTSTLAFFVLSTSATKSEGLFAEDIKKTVGTGCSNVVSFQSFFTTDVGDTCSSCTFCNSSRLSSIFDPKVENTCIDCGTAENSCKNFQVVTDFATPWMMNFMTLTSSTMGSENDPFQIVIKAFDGSSNAWQNIYDSDLSFAERKKEQVLILNNTKSYNTYSVLFERNITSASLYLGQYGIVETYLKGCTAELHRNITGSDVSPYKTPHDPLEPSLEPSLESSSQNSTLSPVAEDAKVFGCYRGGQCAENAHGCCDCSIKSAQECADSGKDWTTKPIWSGGCKDICTYN